MKLIIVSDTHGAYPRWLPYGDVFIHAGDITARGTVEEYAGFNEWVKQLPHPNKLVIGGNHDIALSKYPEVEGLLQDCTYLRDSGVEIDGVNFWGSPYTPDFFPEHWVFNQPRGSEVTKARWEAIPECTNVLITHGPPHGILDECPDMHDRTWNVHVGCEDLMSRVRQLKDLRAHVFGHIHESRGVREQKGVKFVNAASVDGRYRDYRTPFQEIDI